MNASMIPALMQQAFAHHGAGRLALAMQTYQAVLRINPGDPDAQYYLGIALLQAGEGKAAVHMLEAALPARNDMAEAHFNLGAAYRLAEKEDDALEAFEAALDKDPAFVSALIELGTLLEQKSKFKDSEARLLQALSLEPNSRPAQIGLAITYRRMLLLEESEAILNTLLAADGDDVEALICLAKVRAEQSELRDGIEVIDRVLALAPSHVQALMTKSSLLAALAEEDDDAIDQALEVARAAVAAAPRLVEPQLQLYKRLVKAKKVKEGVETLHEVIRQDPTRVHIYEELSTHYDDAGFADEARRILECRLQVEDDPGVRMRRAVVLPPMPKDAEEIALFRSRMGEELDALIKDLKEDDIRIDDPLTAVNRTGFYLAYHALGNLDLQRKMVEAISLMCPSLLQVAPHCVQQPDGTWRSNEPPGGKIRLCLLSRHFRTHTIAKLNVRLIEQLPRDRFEITIAAIGPAKGNEFYERIVANADHVIGLPTDLPTCRERINAGKFDILYMPDIGMDTCSYYLSFARMAPLQVYSWGHPDSPATPGLDVFLSSENLEGPGADSHYAERLVRLKTVNTCYERPEGPEHWKNREEMGLPTEGTLYGIPQTYFKFHPDVDRLYLDILRKDPNAWFVMIHPPFSDWLDRLRERWRALDPNLEQRMWVIPGMKRQEFFNLCKLCNVLIDPPHFGGGNSSLEAFAFGVPVVTWPGEYLRGRITAALYADVGITGLTAKRLEDLADLAVKVATDAEYSEQMTSEILDKGWKWFDNSETAQETITWLLDNAPHRVGKQEV